MLIVEPLLAWTPVLQKVTNRASALTIDPEPLVLTQVVPLSKVLLRNAPLTLAIASNPTEVAWIEESSTVTRA